MEEEINMEVIQGFHEPDLKEAFELFDEDKDGEITIDELQKIMNLHGFYPSDEELQIMIENCKRIFFPNYFAFSLCKGCFN